MKCLNILYNLENSGDLVPISILCLSTIYIICFPVIFSALMWSSSILVCFVPWLWYNELPSIPIYFTDPLSMSLGKLGATPEICSATLSTGYSMLLHCFSEIVVALKGYSRYFYGGFVVTPGLLLMYVEWYNSVSPFLSYISEFFCLCYRLAIGGHPHSKNHIHPVWRKSLNLLPSCLCVNKTWSFIVY